MADGVALGNGPVTLKVLRDALQDITNEKNPVNENSLCGMVINPEKRVVNAGR